MDDFGLHAGVTEAVVTLAGQHRVHATSCMVGAPAWREAAGVARQLKAQRGIDLGLHLDFSQWPLDRASARPLSKLLAASLTGRLDASRVRAEVAGQLDAFERDTGQPPDFIDGHQHVHELPTIRQALFAELDARYRSALPWLRSTRRAAGLIDAKAFVIEHLGDAPLRREARARGIGHNAHLLGVRAFRGGVALFEAQLQAWIDGAQDGDLLMCHPAQHADASLAHAEQRLAEYRVLLSPRMLDMLRERGAFLQPMSAIVHSLAGGRAVDGCPPGGHFR